MKRPALHRGSYARRLAPFAIALGLIASTPCAGVTDLTDLSLQDLMNVEAAGSSSQFIVSAVAVESCMVSATNHLFGNYDPLRTTPTDNNSIVTVVCTVDSTYDIGLSTGSGSGATVTTRRMSASGRTLDYSLYRDPSRSQVWGNTAGADTVQGVGTGLPFDHAVFGRIPAKQVVPRGAYSDVITITVSY